ncbi:MAG: hypothetical protein Q9190_000799 [Brigantiaea leucoxantha]
MLARPVEFLMRQCTNTDRARLLTARDARHAGQLRNKFYNYTAFQLQCRKVWHSCVVNSANHRHKSLNTHHAHHDWAFAILLPATSAVAIVNTTTILSTPESLHLGINCRGHPLCYTDVGAVWYLRDLAYGTAWRIPTFPRYNYGPIDDTSLYAAGKHIVCKSGTAHAFGGFCVFTQGAKGSVSGRLVKRKLTQLLEHGCWRCGSVPLEKGNDPNKEGILTVNYVQGNVCRGVCRPPGV